MNPCCFEVVENAPDLPPYRRGAGDTRIHAVPTAGRAHGLGTWSPRFPLAEPDPPPAGFTPGRRPMLRGDLQFVENGEVLHRGLGEPREYQETEVRPLHVDAELGAERTEALIRQSVCLFVLVPWTPRNRECEVPCAELPLYGTRGTSSSTTCPE